MRQIEKHSNVANKIPSVNVLADGEIALNTHDSKIFQKRSDGVLVEHSEWEPKLYEVQDITERDALTPKNGQYASYADGGDSILDMWYDGSWVLIQRTPPVPPRFLMHVTAPTEPTYTVIIGGTLTTVDNNDGTWTLSSNDTITKIESKNKVDVEVVVESALDLVDIQNTWYSCTNLTSFDTSGLTAAKTARNAWNYCSSLTAFDASGLTSVTSAPFAWGSCAGLTSFDTSGLTSVTDINNAWQSCNGFVSFDTSGLTAATATDSSWRNCKGLTSFDTSGLTSVISVEKAWEHCTNLTSFDASGLTSVTNVSFAWYNCPFTPNPPLNPSTGTSVWP